MADEAIRSHITGIEETIERLRQLGAAEPKVIAKANRAGAKVIKRYAIAEAPSRSGLTRSNITIRTRNRKARGLYRAYVGVGQKDWTGPSFYAAFVLWGHKVGSRKLGDARRDVPANDWLKRAAAKGAVSAVAAHIDQLKTGVQEAWENK